MPQAPTFKDVAQALEITRRCRITFSQLRAPDDVIEALDENARCLSNELTRLTRATNPLPDTRPTPIAPPPAATTATPRSVPSQDAPTPTSDTREDTLDNAHDNACERTDEYALDDAHTEGHEHDGPGTPLPPRDEINADHPSRRADAPRRSARPRPRRRPLRRKRRVTRSTARDDDAAPRSPPP